MRNTRELGEECDEGTATIVSLLYLLAAKHKGNE